MISRKVIWSVNDRASASMCSKWVNTYSLNNLMAKFKKRRWLSLAINPYRNQYSTIISRIAPLTIIITLLISLLIIAINPPAIGYEISIYEAYPAVLWAFVSINILLSIYVIVRRCEGVSKGWVCGYFSVLLLQTVILLLPTIRGYFAMDRGSGDIFYHLSVVLHIQNTGSILQTDTYPMMHIILAILQFTSVDLMMLAFMISIVFFILYVFFFYILGKTVLGSTRGGILFSVFALPLVFSFAHYAYYPFLFALFLIPLVLFILSKLNTITQNRSGYYVCIVGLSLFITYCHPLIAIIIFIMFSIFALFKIFYHGLTGIYKSNNVAMNIAFISFSTFSLWYIQHMSLMQTSERVFSSIFGDSNADTILNYQMNVLSASDASPWLVAERFIKYYGPVSLYIFISLIFVMYSVFNYYRNGKIHTQDTIYSIHFIAAIFIGALLVMENLVIFEPIRAVSYCLIFSTILCGLFFYRL